MSDFASPAEATVLDDVFERLRYDDLTQDGRLVLASLSAMLGTSVWARLTQRDEVMTLASQGIVPILTRSVYEGTPGPFGLSSPMHVSGRFALAHGVDEDGSVARLYLNMWLQARAPSGTTWVPAEVGASPILAGRLFAEHVFTRPFGPAHERKVLSLDLPGHPGVPPVVHTQAKAVELLTIPPGACQVGDPEVVSGVLFSVMHTDSNQHVNSLVYPRLFEEAAISALGRTSRDVRVLSRRCDVRYRKPFFAGDRAKVVVKLYELEGRLFATGGFLVDGEPLPRTSCRIFLE